MDEAGVLFAVGRYFGYDTDDIRFRSGFRRNNPKRSTCEEDKEKAPGQF